MLTESASWMSKSFLNLISIFFGFAICERCIGLESQTGVGQAIYKHWGVRTFFNEKSIAEVAELKHCEDRTTSFFAAWINCKHAISDMRDPTHLQSTLPHKYEFLGFVGGRLNLTIPSFWREAIIEIKTDEANNLPPSKIRHDPPSTVKWKNNIDIWHNMSHANSLSIKSFEEKLLKGTLEGEPFALDWNNTQRPWRVNNCQYIDVHKIPGRGILVVVTGKQSHEAFVKLLDASGEVVWNTEIDLASQININGAMSESWNGAVATLFRDDLIAVFGVNSTSIYLFTLRVCDGSVDSFFTTLF